MSADANASPGTGGDASPRRSNGDAASQRPHQVVVVPEAWADELGIDEVLAAQGLDPRAGAARLPSLVAAAKRALEEGRCLFAPAVVSRALDIARADATCVVFTDGTVLRDPAVSCLLAGAEEAVAVACTVGGKVERRSARLMGADPVLGLAFDGLGTAALNLLAAAVCRDLRAAAVGRGWGMTSPVSPGQGEWDLREGQRFLFAQLPADAIGVSLSEHGQMRPCKSLSFLVGLGPCVREREGGQCAFCSSRGSCQWRRHREGSLL